MTKNSNNKLKTIGISVQIILFIAYFVVAFHTLSQTSAHNIKWEIYMKIIMAIEISIGLLSLNEKYKEIFYPNKLMKEVFDWVIFIELTRYFALNVVYVLIK